MEYSKPRGVKLCQCFAGEVSGSDESPCLPSICDDGKGTENGEQTKDIVAP